MAEYLNKPFAIQNGPDAEKIDYNFDILFRRLRNLETGATPHNILSDTHPDTTPATLGNGDILIVTGGKLARLAIGSNGQFLKVASLLPSWATLVATDLPAHDLLGAQHGDTTAASPQLGDIVVGEQDTQVESINDSKYWLDGKPLDFISTGVDPGTQQYWLDGKPSNALLPSVGVGAVTWRRKAVGSNDQVLTVVAGRPAWQTASYGGDGARAYRSSDLSTVYNTVTTVTLSATDFDNAGFWNAGAPTGFTIPSSGVYVIVGQATWDNVGFGLAYAEIFVDGTKRASQQNGINNVDPAYGDRDPQQVVAILSLTAGQFVDFRVRSVRLSGANMTLVGGADRTWFSIVKVG